MDSAFFVKLSHFTSSDAHGTAGGCFMSNVLQVSLNKIIVAIKCDLLKHCLRKACVGPFNQVTGVSFLSNIF